MLQERAGRPRWVRHCEARETRERLSRALEGWWKWVHPFRAWRLHRARRAASEVNRLAANRRLADPALARFNEERRRAVLVQEDRTLVVAGAGTGKTHTMVEKARHTVRTSIARPDEIAFVTFTRKAAKEIRERSADLEGMEIGTLHHLARRVIEVKEGARPALSALAGDDTARLERIEAWLRETNPPPDSEEPRPPLPSGGNSHQNDAGPCRGGFAAARGASRGASPHTPLAAARADCPVRRGELM